MNDSRLYQPCRNYALNLSAQDLCKIIQRDACMASPVYEFTDVEGNKRAAAIFCVKSKTGVFELYRMGRVDPQGTLSGTDRPEFLYPVGLDKFIAHMFDLYRITYEGATETENGKAIFSYKKFEALSQTPTRGALNAPRAKKPGTLAAHTQH